MATPVQPSSLSIWIPIVVFAAAQIGREVYFVGSTSSEIRQIREQIQSISTDVHTLMDKTNSLLAAGERRDERDRSQDRRLEILERGK